MINIGKAAILFLIGLAVYGALTFFFWLLRLGGVSNGTITSLAVAIFVVLCAAFVKRAFPSRTSPVKRAVRG